MPPILFKYRDDSENTQKIIATRQIWLSTPEKLNDPLECRTGAIPVDWKRKVILKQEQAQLMGMLLGPALQPVETLFSLDRRQTKRWLKAFAKVSHADKVQRMHKLYREHGIILSDPSKVFDRLEAQLNSVGIFSLSASGNNDPMWAHYAGNHSGLALGFGVTEGSKLADPERTLQVVYADEKPIFTDGLSHEVMLGLREGGGFRSKGRFSFTDPVFQASISTKPRAWSYEQEWRYVNELSGLHDLPGELVRVTFGIRMPADRKAFYAHLLRDHGFSVELMEVALTPLGSLNLIPAQLK